MPNVSCAIGSSAGSGGSGYLENMGSFCEMSAVIGLTIISLSVHWLIMWIFDFGFCRMVFNIWELWSMKIFGLGKASRIKCFVVSFLYVVFHSCLAQSRYTANNCWVNEWIWWEKQLPELSRWKSKEPLWIYYGITLASYKGRHTCLYFYYVPWV